MDELVREIAITLYVHELDAPLLWPRNKCERMYDDPASTGPHCGDCTKVAATCLRCVRDEADTKARAILSALSNKGMAVVPVEPTEAMKHDGSAAYDYPSVYMGGPSEGGKRLSARIWKAMLAARPSLKEGV